MRTALSNGRLLTFNWSGIDFQTVEFSHFRDKDRNEVNIVIENRRGLVVGVEVKASATVTKSDFGGWPRRAAKAWARAV